MSAAGRSRAVFPVLCVVTAGLLPMVTPAIQRRLGPAAGRRR